MSSRGRTQVAPMCVHNNWVDALESLDLNDQRSLSPSLDSIGERSSSPCSDRSGMSCETEVSAQSCGSGIFDTDEDFPGSYGRRQGNLAVRRPSPQKMQPLSERFRLTGRYAASACPAHEDPDLTPATWSNRHAWRSARSAASVVPQEARPESVVSGAVPSSLAGNRRIDVFADDTRALRRLGKNPCRADFASEPWSNRHAWRSAPR